MDSIPGPRGTAAGGDSLSSTFWSQKHQQPPKVIPGDWGPLYFCAGVEALQLGLLWLLRNTRRPQKYLPGFYGDKNLPGGAGEMAQLVKSTSCSSRRPGEKKKKRTWILSIHMAVHTVCDFNSRASDTLTEKACKTPMYKIRIKKSLKKKRNLPCALKYKTKLTSGLTPTLRDYVSGNLGCSPQSFLLVYFFPTFWPTHNWLLSS